MSWNCLGRHRGRGADRSGDLGPSSSSTTCRVEPGMSLRIENHLERVLQRALKGHHLRLR